MNEHTEHHLENEHMIDDGQSHHESEHHDHEAAKDQAWLAAEASHLALLELMSEKSVVVLSEDSPSFGTFKEHVVSNKETLEIGCIDERCGHQHEGYTVGLGGAGILWDAAKRSDYVKFLVDKAVEDGVKKINVDAHEGCGAAKLYLTNVVGQENPSSDDVNRAAIEFTKQLESDILAEIANRGLEIVVSQGYLDSTKMLGSSDFHDAIGATVDTTSQFDPTRSEGHDGQDLPPLFNVNGTFDADHAAANVGVALNIAFGDHGFGPRFTKERPFVIAVVVNSKDQVSSEKSNQVAEKIRQAVAERPEFIDGRVLVHAVDIGAAIV